MLKSDTEDFHLKHGGLRVSSFLLVNHWDPDEVCGFSDLWSQLDPRKMFALLALTQ